MKKIKYYYSSMSKQVFLILLTLMVFVRFFIFYLVINYNLLGKAYLYNIPATILLNIVYIVLCFLFLFGFKFFYAEFDENRIIQHNLLLRKKVDLDLDTINRAVFSKRGIYLYKKGNESHSMFISFHRFGFVSPVGVDEFFKLINTKDIYIKKNFVILPGCGKIKKIIPVFYSGFALITLGYLTQAIALASAILKKN